MRILFDSKLSQFKTPFGVLHPGKPCTMHIQIPVSCRTTRVQLLLLRENCGTEREIEKLEGQLAALDAESEANATDYQKLMELDAQKQALNAQLEALYEAWEALCE